MPIDARPTLNVPRPAGAELEMVVKGVEGPVEGLGPVIMGRPVTGRDGVVVVTGDVLEGKDYGAAERCSVSAVAERRTGMATALD